ncbi:rhodanese-like domain-containing protein [Thioalkalivibrio paradoxus]|uniref:Sulfurtransferase n=1 Tax=Thioalkalivibrio paradoxus ARh 1 TaxID=713585 RepID=W0DIC2_9GAMM|nr:rhodanese-like domain-containing protein [Thioalkalivibrio paradoxus]AHE98374.1 sulfurtransferase [Thioalkalivibrio paradoxus ARh 1]
MIQQRKPGLATLIALAALTTAAASADDFDTLEVGITPELDFFAVQHQGETVWVQRNQDTGNTVDPEYALTSRPCPPLCIQPMQLAPGVETLGELEFIAYLERVGRDSDVLVIDSRTADEFAAGAIPGAVNVPWNDLVGTAGAVDFVVEMRMEEFGVRRDGDGWDFSDARTLVLYCNGPWCGQTPSNIRTLLDFGYPPERLKWYRGGMQAWHSLGFTVVD